MKTVTKTLAALSMMTLIVMGGTASATYAWYQLSQDKTIEISGTSFRKSTDLEIGFVSAAVLSYDGLTYSADDSAAEGRNIYWSDSIKVSSELTDYVLKANGYATDKVYPVTSGAYQTGQALTLYDAPAFNCTFDQVHREADSKMYMSLTLAFKIVNQGGSSVPMSDSKIYLSDYQLAGSAKTAGRVYLHSDTLSALIDPSASDAGFTYVGGPLDLNQDGKFDAVMDDSDGEMKEVFYGQSTGALQYASPYAGSVSTVSRNFDCFANPNHDQGTHPLANVSSYAAKADYETLTPYLYTDGELDASDYTPVAYTDINGIAILTFDFFIEGWDRSMINQEIGSALGSAISFSTNGD